MQAWQGGGNSINILTASGIELDVSDKFSGDWINNLISSGQFSADISTLNSNQTTSHEASLSDSWVGSESAYSSASPEEWFV